FARPLFEALRPASTEKIAREQIAGLFVVAVSFVFGLAVHLGGGVDCRLGLARRRVCSRLIPKIPGFRLFSLRRTGDEEEQPGNQEAPRHAASGHGRLLPWKRPDLLCWNALRSILFTFRLRT